MTPASVSRTVEVAAPAERVWDLVSDLPRMGEWSPENRGGRWLRGGGPAVGAVFAGTNGSGVRRWSTRCTVVRCERPLSFAFDVTFLGLGVASWAYDVEPTGTGCRLTETWTDARSPLVAPVGRLVSGVEDRVAFTATSIERTLAGVRAAAQARR
jgi:uncharacterized protein YndB with AHSA1/START domain